MKIWSQKFTFNIRINPQENQKKRKNWKKVEKKDFRWIYPDIKKTFLRLKSSFKTLFMQLRPRINSLEKNSFL